MHLNVHSSTIYNSQDMEAIQMPLNRQMDEEDVAHTHTHTHTHTHNGTLCACVLSHVQLFVTP